MSAEEACPSSYRKKKRKRELKIVCKSCFPCPISFSGIPPNFLSKSITIKLRLKVCCQ